MLKGQILAILGGLDFGGQHAIQLRYGDRIASSKYGKKTEKSIKSDKTSNFSEFCQNKPSQYGIIGWGDEKKERTKPVTLVDYRITDNRNCTGGGLCRQTGLAERKGRLANR